MKLSLEVVWGAKGLLVFPIISGIATVLVMASFVYPLWNSGQLEHWLTGLEERTLTNTELTFAALTVFAFYYVNYFTILFFNSALMVSVLQVLDGKSPSLRSGVRGAWHRFHAIAGWAFVSAIVGMILKVIENNHQGRRWLSALLGSAWTALTFFVIPILVVRGENPIRAFGSSVRIMKQTWGTALVGSFSLNGLLFLLALPLFLLLGLGIAYAVNLGVVALSLAIGCGIAVFTLFCAFSSCVAHVFKAILFRYATSETLPEQLQGHSYKLNRAFQQKAR